MSDGNNNRRNRQRDNKRKGQADPGAMSTVEGALATSTNKPTEEKGVGGLRALASTLMQRLNLSNLAGMQFSGLRDLYKVFGYESRPTADQFYSKYIRQDIASRIIDAPPGATWSNPPTFKASDAFNNAFKEIENKHNIWGILNRCDRLARLGHYSIFMFGFDDSSPKNAVGNVNGLLYARPISSRMVKRITFVKDPTNPRFGLPENYEISFDDPNQKIVTADNVTIKGMGQLVLHHSRAIHIVENPLEDTVFGIPIIERIYNLLDDLLKVSGGVSEMFWLGARQGMQADIDKEMDLDPTEASALSDELDEFQHQLRRIVRTRGVTLKTLESQVASPKDTFDMIMSLISGTTGIPRRILLGSEAGQLASEQDRANWAERIDERRKLFAGPIMLKPMVDKLIEVGLLPEEKYTINWPSAFLMNPLEEGQMMAQKARAVGNFSRQTGNATPMQLTSRTEAREIMMLEGDLSDSDLYELAPHQQEERDTKAQQEKDKVAAIKEGGNKSDMGDTSGQVPNPKAKEKGADK